jgi:hypothetical protein
MATPDEILALRRMTALGADTTVYDDVVLNDMIDELGINAAAAAVWSEKASALSTLVDVSESGSSRNMSQAYKGALAMAQHYAGQDSTPEDNSLAATTRPIVRES